MVWRPNILNNCYELSGGYAPRTTHQGLFSSQTPGASPPPNPGYTTDAAMESGERCKLSPNGNRILFILALKSDTCRT